MFTNHSCKTFGGEKFGDEFVFLQFSSLHNFPPTHSPDSFHRSKIILQTFFSVEHIIARFCLNTNVFLMLLSNFCVICFISITVKRLMFLIIFCGILSPTENTELENVPY